jgi:deoxyhypusine synthase
MEKKFTNRDRIRCDGISDNLEPLESLDLSKVASVNDLLASMKKTSFNGRKVGEAADVLEAMARDQDCYVVLTLAGAMTMAKMGLVVCDMIERGMVNAIVSTGALMAHGFVESSGMLHFKHNEDMDDRVLYSKGYNRIYDTIELEKNLDDAEKILGDILGKCDRSEKLCSWKINRMLGKYLVENTKGRGILKSAYENDIPVFVPSFTDSELALDFHIFNIIQRMKNEKEIEFDAFADLEYYANIIKHQKTLGIFTIGGGVPRNWTQQVGPFLDIIDMRIRKNKRFQFKYKSPDDHFFKRFKYAVRISTALVQDGGLSGCTYSEGVSWGKIMPKSEGGMWSEVFSDATVAWPMIVKAVMERLDKKPEPKKSLPKVGERMEI